jgi:hypothetical protein
MIDLTGGNTGWPSSPTQISPAEFLGCPETGKSTAPGVNGLLFCKRDAILVFFFAIFLIS